MNKAVADSMLERGLRYNPEEHEIVQDREGGISLWMDAVYRFTRRKSLFLYRHRVVGSWVLADWANPPGNHEPPVMVEVKVMPDKPDNLPGGPPGMDKVAFWLTPFDEMKRRWERSWKERARVRERKREETFEHRHKLVERYKNSKPGFAEDVALGRINVPHPEDAARVAESVGKAL